MKLSSFLRRITTGKRSHCAAVIVASGTAQRMGGIDKVMAPLRGKPVILWTIKAFQENPQIQEIVVVTREDLVTVIEDLCRAYEITKLRAVVVGGATRTQSVLAGLNAVSRQTTLVAIQDGARPLVTERIIADTVQKAGKTGAAAPAIPVKDTIKVASNGVIRSTPDRSTLFAVQTPQVFDLDLIRGALYKSQTDQVSLTDDCSAAEYLGMKVHLVEGSEENLKITTPIDLRIAQILAEGRRMP